MFQSSDQADALPIPNSSVNGGAAPSWPDVMSGAAYGRYRREVFGAGSKQLISKYVKQGKISAPALRNDGKIERLLADRQLAATLDPSRNFDRPDPSPEDAPEEDEIATVPAGSKTAYSVAQTALAESRRRLVDLDVAEREGRLIDKAAAERETFDTARRVRDRLLSLPHKLAARLVGRSEPEIITLLREALTETLTAAADEIEDAPPDDDAG